MAIRSPRPLRVSVILRNSTEVSVRKSRPPGSVAVATGCGVMVVMVRFLSGGRRHCGAGGEAEEQVLEVGAVGDLPDELARAAHRVVQEALTNVHKHARGPRPR